MTSLPCRPSARNLEVNIRPRLIYRHCILVNGVGQRDYARKSQLFSWDSVQVVACYRRDVKRAVVIAAILVGASASPLDAEIEGTTFSSKTANVRMTMPRGWRWSDQATYPGILLRMNRTRPRAAML